MALTATVLLVALVACRDTLAVPLAANNTTNTPMQSAGISLTVSTDSLVSGTRISLSASVVSPLLSSTDAQSISLTAHTDSTNRLSSVSLSTAADINSSTSVSLVSTVTSLVNTPSVPLSKPTSPSTQAFLSSLSPADTSFSSVLSVSTGSIIDSANLPGAPSAPTPAVDPFATSSVTQITTAVSTVYQSAPAVTITAPPQTVTDTITIVPPPTPSSTVRETVWSAPPQMTDLSPFNIKNFAYGKKNMRIIVNDPAIDGVSSNSYSQYQSQSKSHSSDILSGVIVGLISAIEAGIVPPPPAKTESSFLQLFYPANSINPGQEPQGGADFYAAPLDLKGARNVSLEYSVFFPSDFHWVEGGKLPGVYGGHDGCSGGDDAVHCFSTRLMWRGGGVGELYLYAPKDKQTPTLCRTPPETVCSSEYGLSIGRGAFMFRAGKWTRVRQTVVLNTPGEQDGAFTLDVNGERVLDLHGVFYRDVPDAPSLGGNALLAEDALQAQFQQEGLFSPPGTGAGPEGARRSRVDSMLHDPNAARDAFTPDFAPMPNASDTGTGDEDDDPDDEFTPEFMPPWGTHFPETFVQDVLPVPNTSTMASVTTLTLITSTTVVVLPTQTVTVSSTSTATVYVLKTETEGAVPTGGPLPRAGPAVAYAAPEPIGFTGLFFSTFFGGHESRFATPKDQFTWFKEFSMTINDQRLDA